MKWITRGFGGLLGKLAGALKIVELVSRGIEVLRGDKKKEAALAVLEEALEAHAGLDFPQMKNAPRVKAALSNAVDALVELENAIEEEVKRQRKMGAEILDPETVDTIV